MIFFFDNDPRVYLECTIIIITLYDNHNNIVIDLAGRQRRPSNDRKGRRPLDVDRYCVARHQVRRSVSAGRVHEDHVLQTLAADHHGRTIGDTGLTWPPFLRE